FVRVLECDDFSRLSDTVGEASHAPGRGGPRDQRVAGCLPGRDPTDRRGPGPTREVVLALIDVELRHVIGVMCDRHRWPPVRCGERGPRPGRRWQRAPGFCEPHPRDGQRRRRGKDRWRLLPRAPATLWGYAGWSVSWLADRRGHGCAVRRNVSPSPPGQA